MEYLGNEPMTKNDYNSQHIGRMLVIAASLLCLAFLSPDAGNLHGSYFLPVALNSSWHQLGDLAAVWCSIKIVAVSVAFFLLVEAVATYLARLKLNRLALAIYCLQAIGATGALAGSYYILKALL